jgi:hypothetical protein
MRLPLVLVSCFATASLWAASEAPPADPPLSRFLPILFYTPDTGVGAGGFLIRNLDNPESGDPSQLIAFATITQKSQIISVAEPKIYWDQGRWEWAGKISGQDFPSEYYGRGRIEVKPDDAEAYDDKRFGLETRLKNIFYDGFFWELELGANWQRFTENHKDEPTPLVDAEFDRWGHKGHQKFVSAALGHDNRSSRVRATSGHLIRTFFRHYSFTTDQDHGNYGTLGLDWKQYMTLTEKQSLALQFYAAEMDREDVPFYLLQGLGGNQVLRGFYGNQFRDYAVTYAQSEWRTLWTPSWGFRVFAGVGAHADRLSAIENSSGKTAGGLGIDYFLDPRSMNNLRLDVGLSQDNVGVYFLYGNAF